MGDRHDAAIAAGAAAPGSVVGLHAALKSRVGAATAGFSLKTKADGITRAPTVLDGWIPPKPGSDAEVFPFLLVRPRTGQDSEQQADQSSTATFEIIVGTLDDSDDGWIDVLLLIDAIRLDLNGSPIIAHTGYSLVGPTTWDIPEGQPRPQWLGVITTVWQIPRPVRTDEIQP